MTSMYLLLGENDMNDDDEADEDERVSWLRRIEITTREFIDSIPLPKHENSHSDMEDQDIAGPPDKT